MAKVIVRATELNNKNIYALQIGVSLCHKLGKLCFITNQGKRCYKLGQLHYCKLGQVLLQIGPTITKITATVVTKYSSYYKLGQNISQIETGITN